MKRLLLTGALLLGAGLAYARLTNPPSVDTDIWCVGPLSKEDCIDQSGNTIPTTDNTESLGTSGLRWNSLNVGTGGLCFNGTCQTGLTWLNSGTNVYNVPGSSVGVNTVSPGAALDVQGNAQFGSTAKSTFTVSGALNLASGVNVTVTGGGIFSGPLTGNVTGNASGLSGPSANQILFGGGANGFQQVSTFTVSGGNVGIGTTSPATALQVVGVVTATGYTGPLTGNVTGNVTGNASGLSGTSANQILFGGGANGFQQVSTFTLVGGNVGIGTTNPAANLDVEGSLLVKQGATVTNIVASSGTATLAYAKVTGGACASSPCTIGGSGNVASITRSATGTYAVNFVAGTFSTSSSVTCTIGNADPNSTGISHGNSDPTTSSWAIVCDTLPGVAQDDEPNVICMGK